MHEDAGGGKPTARAIAEKMVERSKILTGKSDSAILAQLLDRTEGKVPGDAPVIQNLNVVFIVGKGYASQLVSEGNDNATMR